MNRMLSSILTLAMTVALGSGAAFANPHSNHGGTMSGHMSNHSMSHRNHRYGNDKARCRDSKGRFLKKSDPRCLAK